MIKDSDDSLTKMIPGFCSQLTTDPRILFGGFPTAGAMRSLQERSVRYIVDLTTSFEKKRLAPYFPKQFGMTYIHFPIQDNSVPYDLEAFNEFIVWLSHLLDSLGNDSIYIHCKGGHGRSGMIVASLLCFHYKKTPEESIRETTIAHQNRIEMTPKWKNRLCPSNPIQRHFLEQVFIPSSRRDLLSEYRVLTNELKSALNSYRKRLLDESSPRIKLIQK